MDAPRAGSASAEELPPPQQPPPPADELLHEKEQHKQPLDGQQEKPQQQKKEVEDEEEQVESRYRYHDGKVYKMERSTGKEEVLVDSATVVFRRILRKLKRNVIQAAHDGRVFFPHSNIALITIFESLDGKGNFEPDVDIVLGASDDGMNKASQDVASILLAQMEKKRAEDYLAKCKEKMVRDDNGVTRFR